MSGSHVCGLMDGEAVIVEVGERREESRCESPQGVRSKLRRIDRRYSGESLVGPFNLGQCREPAYGDIRCRACDQARGPHETCGREKLNGERGESPYWLVHVETVPNRENRSPSIT